MEPRPRGPLNLCLRPLVMHDSCDSFWELWQRHSEHLFRQSLRMMKGNQSEAEDAFGATMLRAYESFPRQTGQVVNARAWLGRLLHNICVDAYRRRRCQETSEAEGGKSLMASQEVGAPSPEALLLRRELGSQLRQHILALPPRLRAPSTLRFLEEMSYDDIASELGMTNCNVRKRIQHAYCLLRTRLGGVWTGAALGHEVAAAA
jgi:RNA polymerase sigma factor (sigma-70 family)